MRDKDLPVTYCFSVVVAHSVSHAMSEKGFEECHLLQRWELFSYFHRQFQFSHVLSYKVFSWEGSY